MLVYVLVFLLPCEFDFIHDHQQAWKWMNITHSLALLVFGIRQATYIVHILQLHYTQCGLVIMSIVTIAYLVECV